jgi:hypothetical protein
VSDPETVLFVDDDECKAAELDLRFDESVCPDEDVDLPGLESREQCTPRRAAYAAGQEGQANAGAAEESREGICVLLGEHFGRSHDRSLQTVSRGEQERECRNDRLPAADVSLEQAGHRAAGCEVPGDLPNRPLLRVRERERERLAGRAPQRVVRSQADPGALAQARALLLDPRRENEKLFVDKRSP